jgi:CheY-like chemotaxis protein
VKWLKAKGYEFRDAVDGRDGVSIYESEGPFEFVIPLFIELLISFEVYSIVLLDLSMPKLDGWYNFRSDASREADVVNRNWSYSRDSTDRVSSP